MLPEHRFLQTLRGDDANVFTRVARTLGPERCASALAAFDDVNAVGDWNRCLLARAYGKPKLLARHATKAKMNDDRFIAMALGIGVSDAYRVYSAFDAWHPPEKRGGRRPLWMYFAIGDALRYRQLRRAFEREAAKVHTPPAPYAADVRGFMVRVDAAAAAMDDAADGSGLWR